MNDVDFELENAVERAVILTPGEYVSEKDLPPVLTQHFESVCGSSDSPQSLGGKSLQEIEKVAIEETLTQTGGNKSEAAKKLGITRTTLDNKIKKYGVVYEK